MPENNEILFDVASSIGTITLNRPQALNALNLAMIRQMNSILAAWAVDPAVRAVVITGAGERAFCSGGDVKSVALDKTGVLQRDFFREEYILNHRIYNFPKPYISLINGIVMGGGKGLSAHGSHRVVTENTLFAMPETGIGFFPDVGGGYFLPRCPGETGVYLALTSKRIKAADTLYIGFATHYVPAEKFSALVAALHAIKWENGAAKDLVTQTIADFSGAPPDVAGLPLERAAIDRCFGHDRVEDIVAALEKDKTPFAQEALMALRGMSPTSLKIALRQIRLGKTMAFAGVMTMEYRLSQALMKRHDFYEGIRAALIDKDRQPKWKPATLEAVSETEIVRCFDSLGAEDLSF